jgi:hypothetical protein
MATNSVLVNDTVRIRVKFVDINTLTGAQFEVSPVAVSVTITDAQSNVEVNDSADQLTASTWYYDFTPTVADTYTVKFVGLLENSTSITVQQKLYVSSVAEEYKPTIILKSDETIVFAPDLDPLYVDPELILSIFPDATLLEIGEIIHYYSLEVKQMYGILDSEDGSNLPFLIGEYIKAATACELTRTYQYGGGDEVSVHLGDLTVINKSIPRNIVTRDSAITWCQIATALRKEIIAGKVGPKAFLPKNLPSQFSGTNVDPLTGKTIYLSDRELYGPGTTIISKDDPMPKRGLKSYD